MKKTSCVQLALITAALASCKTSSYQQNACPVPPPDSCQQAMYIPDSCNDLAGAGSYYDVIQFFLNNITIPYAPAAAYSHSHKVSGVMLHRPAPGFLHSFFVVRGGFGASSRKASS